MLTFKTGTSLALSTLQVMGSSDGLTNNRKSFACYLYSGVVPNSIADIPFDIHSPFEVSRNCDAMSFAAMYQKDGEDAATLEGDHMLNVIPVKRSALDIKRNSYRLAPRYSARYDTSAEYLNEFPGTDPTNSTHSSKFPNQSPGELDDPTFVSYQNQLRYGDLAPWYNEKYSGTPGNVGVDWTNYGGPIGTRYGVNDDSGQYMEFEQDVTVDGLEIRGYSNTSYTSAQWTLEYWDEATGAWVTHYTNDGSNPSFNTDSEVYTDIPPITAKKFLLSSVNTGRYWTYVRHVSLFSSTEPFNTAPVDLTWALIAPCPINQANTIARSDTESYSEIGRMAFMMCSVGDPRDPDHLLVLNKASGLPGYFNPRILNLNFEFVDPEVNV